MGRVSPEATVVVTREVTASAARVFALVADLPRMGEWSPENTGGRWVGGAQGPAVGARFRGRNRAGARRWSTLATVTEYEPDRRFAFDVTVGGLAVANWAFEVEPRGEGCTVTERFTDRRGRIVRVGGTIVSGVGDRPAHNRAGMEVTLERLAVAAEGAGGDETPGTAPGTAPSGA